MTSQGLPARDADDATETAEPAGGPERSHDGLLRLLAAAFLARAIVSLVDAIAIATSGTGFFEVGGIARADGSPTWSILWGLVSLAAGVLLLQRRPLGWVLAAGASIAYLVVGVAHTVDATSSATGVPPGVWLIFAADVLIPSLVLAGLFTVRPWFLAAARAAHPKSPGPAPTR